MKPLVSIAVLVLFAVSAGFCIQQTDNQPPPSAQTEPTPTEPQTQVPEKEAPKTEEPKTTPPQAQEPAKKEAPSPAKQSPAKHKRKKRKPATSQPTATQPSKVIVRNGGAKETSPQIAPAMSKDYELHQRATTTQLLAATDVNVKKISGRQLPQAQQSVLDQIHTYVLQAKAASDAGDLERAHTLALKARLLSDDLARR
jgi:outer membrane biosynthesis protein TonB